MAKKRYKSYLIVSLLVAFGSLAAVIFTGTTPQLGLDLKGGVSVILTAEGEAPPGDVLSKTVDIIRQRINALGVAESDVSAAGSNNIIVQIPGIADKEKALRIIGTTAQLTFRQVEKVYGPGAKDKPEVTDDTSDEVAKETVVYPSADNEGTLYELKPAVLTGEVVTDAEAVVDSTTGTNWSVSIDMNSEGSDAWATFTSKLACLRDKATTPEQQTQAQVAIVLDGKVESAAGMRSPQEAGSQGGVTCEEGITGGQTQIDVGDEVEAKDLALVLRAGSLPLTLTKSQVQEVSPTLGRSSLDAGIKAGLIGLGLVFIYVLLYYRALGLIVWLGLTVFTAVMYAILALLGETAGLTLTLAGIAGIIVSIGITCDSYIVAFERLKDEVRSGKSMRAAVDRGMVRAFRTILVADFVTGAAAVILFFLAVGPVKGFALTLGLATIVDVLTAYFFTRSAVTLLAKTTMFAGAGFLGMHEALGAES
jgi:protein-export membrane protein SecD